MFSLEQGDELSVETFGVVKVNVMTRPVDDFQMRVRHFGHDFVDLRMEHPVLLSYKKRERKQEMLEKSVPNPPHPFS